MILRHIYSTLIAALLLSLSIFCHAEIAIVVSKDSPISDAEVKEIQHIYLGKSKKINGKYVKPINHLDGSNLYNQFNRVFLKKSNSQMKSYWSRLVFTGKGTPPESVNNDDEMLVRIMEDPSTIGYIDFNSVSADIRVLLTL